MRVSDRFTYRNQGVKSFDFTSLMQVYYPIIKVDAYVLYQYLYAFYDQGKKEHAFHEILNHTLMNFQRFQEALAILTAVDLVKFYQDSSCYLIELLAPLPKEKFLKQDVYRKMLEGIIGQAATKEMLSPALGLRDISKSFSDVFGLEAEEKLVVAGDSKVFDLDSFKRLMARDGLLFADEKKDVVTLYSLCERYKMTWYDCYQLAKETASQNRIQVARILAKKKQATTPVASEFSEKEQLAIKEAKSSTATVFFAKIKKLKQAVITKDEMDTISELAQMGFLDDLINAMVLYTLNKTKSSNLNRTYVLKVANDLKAKSISRVEEAVLHFRPKEHKKSSKSRPKVNNTPKWSNPDYKNDTSDSQKMQLGGKFTGRLDSLKEED